jgi:hypothetical protein
LLILFSAVWFSKKVISKRIPARFYYHDPSSPGRHRKPTNRPLPNDWGRIYYAWNLRHLLQGRRTVAEPVAILMHWLR